MRAFITGAGNMGQAIAGALEARGDEVVAIMGRSTERPDVAALAPIDVTFEFSHQRLVGIQVFTFGGDGH